MSKVDAEDFAGALAFGITDAEGSGLSNLPELQRASHTWLRAYASASSADLTGAMAAAEITPPEILMTNPGADEYLALSIRALAQIEFDPGKTRVIAVREGIAHPFADRPTRRATRDAARPFLARAGGRERVLRHEVLMEGVISGAPSGTPPVTFGIEFGWNPAAKAWIPIATSLYDLPNEVDGNAPVL